MGTSTSVVRNRWAAIGAAAAVTLGAVGVGVGGMNFVGADGISSGDRPVFVSINPCRLLDTRAGQAVGPKTSPLGPAEVLTVTAHGSNGECTGASTIPADALSLVMNVTATGATAGTFLTFWGEGANPGTSNLNPSPGAAPTPNAVNTPLSTAGTFNIYNDAGSVNAIIDVNGYYAPHDHDDRYYTESETNSQIAATGAEIIATSGLNLTIVDFDPDRVFFSENFTTTKAGYLVITKSFIGSVTCASARGYYLVLDDVGIQNSLVYDSVQEIQRRDIYGVTPTVIPAGDHTISIGGECTSGNSTGSNSTAVYSSRIVVHPG